MVKLVLKKANPLKFFKGIGQNTVFILTLHYLLLKQGSPKEEK